MRRQERNYEIKLNVVPQLKKRPKALLKLLCMALLNVILKDKETKPAAGHMGVTEEGKR